jgi:hypothetical protein
MADHQTIKWNIRVERADLFTCSSAGSVLHAMGIGSMASDATQSLLPTNRQSWQVRGTTFAHSVLAYHPTVNGARDASECVIEIHIQRVWGVVFVKNMSVERDSHTAQ